MKKLLSILCAVFTVVSVSSCGVKQEKEYLEISNETIKVRDIVFEKGNYKNRGTAEGDLITFEGVMNTLSARTGQNLPDAELANKVQNEGENLYSLSKVDYENIVMYIHGGAWIYEISPYHLRFCDKLVNEIDAKVYIPLYPLSPQATYVETYEMLTKVYKELLNENKPIILMGDSAGGELSLGLVHKLITEDIKLPTKLIAISPCPDGTFSNKELMDYAKNDGMLSPYFCKYCLEKWAGDGDLKNPLISPIYGEFKGFPDILIFTGTYEILYPDIVKLYEKICNANINATLITGKGFWHVYPIYPIEEQVQCIEYIKKFVK